MIQVRETERPLFILHTEHTTYAMKVLANGQIEHLHYGARIGIESSDGLTEQHAYPPGNTSIYDREHGTFSPEDMRYEVSALGKGDVREPYIEASYADGCATLDFVYESYEIGAGKPPLKGLPSSYGTDEEVETLIVTLRDRNGALALKLIYSVYEAEDIITRSAVLENHDESAVTLRRLMSLQLDFDAEAYTLHTFTGAWAREMKRTELPLRAGKTVNAARTGVSSNRANPFVMLSKAGAGEDCGECYGFHLVYSGNHAQIAERSPYGKLRFLSGINPDGFCWRLEPGSSFFTPEAVLSYAARGYGELSRRLHRFIRGHIVRGAWQYKERPVLLNSWEAAYFDISESKLYRLARVAKSVGVELFVMDDGWFGHRTDDSSSLGDWTPDPKKLPNGIRGIAERIRDLGLDFGIWVEPEMVSEDSELYRAHPDWAMRIPGREHSTGRNQMFLDLRNPEVQNHIIKQISDVISSAPISYIKWDMNRSFTDVYSPSLPAERQGEAAHRYLLGLYRVLGELTAKFPEVLFEGCASGGNRFDLGMLCYFPQIWGSDDTDAIARAEIQYGYSYGYPMSCVSAHISDVPNHQTLRRTPIETRYAVAAAGVLGYECNLNDLSSEELGVIREQIALYKEWRATLQYGDYYRGQMWTEGEERSVLEPLGGDASWTVVAPDRSRAVSTVLQLYVRPNVQTLVHRPKGLAPERVYQIQGRKFQHQLRDFGGLVNYVSPVHVKQDGAVQSILSKFVKLEAEEETHRMRGDALLFAGLHLKPAFSGTGYDENVRFYPDYASRMYFYTAEEEAPRS